MPLLHCGLLPSSIRASQARRRCCASRSFVEPRSPSHHRSDQPPDAAQSQPDYRTLPIAAGSEDSGRLQCGPKRRTSWSRIDSIEIADVSRLPPQTAAEAHKYWPITMWTLSVSTSAHVGILRHIRETVRAVTSQTTSQRMGSGHRRGHPPLLSPCLTLPGASWGKCGPLAGILRKCLWQGEDALKTYGQVEQHCGAMGLKLRLTAFDYSLHDPAGNLVHILTRGAFRSLGSRFVALVGDVSSRRL